MYRHQLFPYQFLVMCIAAGCDFAPHIHNMGPAGALKLTEAFSHWKWIQEHRTDDDPTPEWAAIMQALPAKCKVPDDWPHGRPAFLAMCAGEFRKAAELFTPDHELLSLEDVALDMSFKLNLEEMGSASGYGSDDIDL